MNQIVLGIIFQKVKEDYEFLLLKRIPEKGGFWQPVGGLIETSDNNSLAAAYREVYEETGITKDSVKRVIENFYQFSFDKHYLTGEKMPPETVFVYAFEVNPEVKITLDFNQDNEHEHFEWFSYYQAIKKLKWENNKDAFKKLKEILYFKHSL